MEANFVTPWEDQKFNVSGFICISVMGEGTRLDMEMLKMAITAVDKDFPWISHYAGGKIAPSINWMSEGVMGEGPGVGRNYNFEIRPPFVSKPSQFYAYHRYLAQLCEELAAKRIEGVHNVSFYLQFGGGGNTYYTPDAQERMKSFLIR